MLITKGDNVVIDCPTYSGSLSIVSSIQGEELKLHANTSPHETVLYM